MRVRTDAGWIDATVRNISSRGMMLHSPQPLQRNQFVEVTRGRSRVVGRIAWADDAMCGLHSQDRVDMAGLLSDSCPSPLSDRAGAMAERRAQSRTTAGGYVASLEFRAESARFMGKALERVTFIGAIICAGGIVAAGAYEIMVAPAAHIAVALNAPDGSYAGR